MDHAWGQREDCCLHIDQPPTSYLKNMYFDTVVFANDQLEFLVQKYGSDKIVLGIDSLSKGDKEAICGLNSAKLLGVNPDDFARAKPQANWS